MTRLRERVLDPTYRYLLSYFLGVVSNGNVRKLKQHLQKLLDATNSCRFKRRCTSFYYMQSCIAGCRYFEMSIQQHTLCSLAGEAKTPEHKSAMPRLGNMPSCLTPFCHIIQQGDTLSSNCIYERPFLPVLSLDQLSSYIRAAIKTPSSSSISDQCVPALVELNSI